MSQFNFSDTSNVVSKTGDTVLKSATTKLFAFIQALHEATRRHNKLMIVIFVMEILQLMAFVGREMSFHPLFDIGPILNYVLPPLFTAEFDQQPKLIVFISSSIFFVVLVAVTLLLTQRKSSNLTVSPHLLTLVKATFELVIHVCALPLASLYFSLLPCGRSSSPSELTFEEFLQHYGCMSSYAYVYRVSAIAALSLLLFLCFTWLLFYHTCFSSRHVFAKSNLKPSTLLWLFRVCYVLIPLFLTAHFFHVLPYFYKQTNLLVLGVLGSWSGFSITYLVYSTLSTNDVVTTILLCLLTPLFASVSVLAGRRRLIKLYNWAQEIKSTLVKEELIGEDLVLSDTFSSESITLDDLGISKSKRRSLIEFELLIKNVLPKLTSSDLFSTSKALIILGKRHHSDDVDFLLFRDSINSSITLQTVNSLITDIDATFSQKFQLFKNLKHLEILRRSQSTGHTVDSSAFLQLQTFSKQITSLHKECLTGLMTFWSVFDSDNVDLSRLPAILSKVHSIKEMLRSRFQKVFTAHGSERSVMEKYAAFLREVECDEQAAASVEEQIQMLTSSDRSSSKGSATMSLSSKQDNHGRKSRRFHQSVLNESTRKGAIHVLRNSVAIASFVMLLLAMVSYFVSTNRMSVLTHRFNQLYELSHIDNTAQNIGSILNQMSLTGELSLSALMLSESEHLSWHVRRLVLSSQDVIDADVCEFPGDPELSIPVAEVKKLLVEPSYSVVITQDLIPPRTESEVMSLWTMGMKLGLDAALFAKDNSLYVNEKNIAEILPVFSAACRDLLPI
ncbi:hypothetical protein GEMRC1_003651 [Eukaryota sp. GEM-RC1]